LVPYGTPLFNHVAALSKGVGVDFSGNLFRNPVDCFKEMSLTVTGAMTEPEFVIRITAVGHQAVAEPANTPNLSNTPPAQQDTDTSRAPQSGTAAFTDGQHARMAYDHWFNSLPADDYRSGAEFWAAHRSDRQPPSCHNGSSEFQAGCTEGAQRLAPSDIRRRTDAEFKLGWNSL